MSWEDRRDAIFWLIVMPGTLMSLCFFLGNHYRGPRRRRRR